MIRKTLILILLVFLPGNSDAFDRGFQHLNYGYDGKEQFYEEISGQWYPQNRQVTWRGSNTKQLPLRKMLRSMFGDASAMMESKFYTAAKFHLMGQKIPFSMTRETESFLQWLDQHVLKDRGAMTSHEAIETLNPHAMRLMTSQSAATLTQKYLDYKAKTYEDFSDQLIYIATLPYIASFYGPRVVELMDTSSRAVDVNYWNYKTYGKWLADGLPAALSFYWEDSGQLIVPVTVPAETITGYQIRDRYQSVDRDVTNSWNIFEWIQKKLIGEFRSVKQSYAPIDYAFYKFRWQDQTIIGVFTGQRRDGSSSTCMRRRNLTVSEGGLDDRSMEEQIPFHCQSKKPWLLPPVEDEAATLIGVIRLCQNSVCESADLEFLDEFPERDTAIELPEQFLREFNHEDFFGQAISYQSL